MRVLGVDPGLTRCGVGVVDGRAGPPLALVDVGVVRTAVRPIPRRERLVAVEDGIDAWLDGTAPTRSRSSGSSPAPTSSTVMGTAQATGIAMVVAARRGLPVALHTPSEVKAAVSRQRPRRQGAGRRDGHPPPRPRRAAQARRRRRRPRPRHLPRLARRHPDPARGGPARGAPHGNGGAAYPRSRRRHATRSAAAASARRSRSPTAHRTWSPAPMIASLSGTVLKVGLDSVVVGSAASACSCTRRPRPRRPCALGQPAELATTPRRARGLADPLRLRRRRREARLRAGADRVRRRPAARPGDARRPLARRRARAPCTGDDVRRSPRCPASAEGRRADHPRAQGPARRAARLGRPGASRAASTPARRGATRCSEALVGLGWTARQADDALDTVAADSPPTAPASRPLLRAALQELGR